MESTKTDAQKNVLLNRFMLRFCWDCSRLHNERDHPVDAELQAAKESLSVGYSEIVDYFGGYSGRETVDYFGDDDTPIRALRKTFDAWCVATEGVDTGELRDPGALDEKRSMVDDADHRVAASAIAWELETLAPEGLEVELKMVKK
jgi:hypothetical protein